MKQILLASLFTLSFNAFSETPVSTSGKVLHLTCVMNFKPFFIELDETHMRADLSLNNRIDSEGRGHSREFISRFKLVDMRETATTQDLIFAKPSPAKRLKTLAITIPKAMPLYMGIPDQPARIDLVDGSEIPGSCHVQFPAMPPQW